MVIPPSKKDEAEPSQTRAVAKPLRRLRYLTFRLREPHDRMPLKQVRKWKKQAQTTDHPEDWIRVAYCVSIGVGKVPPDSKERDFILSRPKVGQWASQNMHQSRWAAYAMGMILFYGMGEYSKDDVGSMDAFEVGYRMKCPQCTIRFAIGYRDGDGVKKDDRRAVEILHEAISYGSLWAKCILGDFYEKGRGVELDCCKAFQFFSDVAEYLFFGVRDKARCFEHGIGVGKDLQLAKDLYQQALDAGYHEATYDLARFLLNGNREEREKAVTILERGVHGGDADCMCYLGALYMDGDVVPKDENKGYSLFQQAASLSDAQAYRFMAECNEGGHGVPQNERRAAEYYEKAAALQDVQAMSVLGISYMQGLLGLSQDVSKGLDWLQRAAEKNDTGAICILGCSYLDGDIVPTDESKGYSLLQQAASLGDAQAYFLMAGCNDCGQGVPRNERRAAEYYEKAAALQYAKAMRVLGISYMQGLRGLSKDVSKGLDWLQHAAEKNDTEAIHFLGCSYLEGDVVPKDESKGYSLLQQAASLGNAEAYFDMARCNDRGLGVSRNERRAVELYEKAAALQNSIAMRVLGILYMQGLLGLSQDVSKGLNWLQRAAEKNDTEAIFFLGGSYLNGDVVPKDESKGYSLLQQAASLGDAEAYFNMARCNDNGWGVPRKERRAVKLYKKAADLQNAKAMRVLGISYMQGLRGLSQDVPKGLDWLQRAVEKNDTEAIHFLGCSYLNGDVVPKDESKGYSLLQQAASLGDAEAYFNMARCNDNGWGVPRKERRAVKLYKKAADMQNAKAMRVLGMSYMQGLRGLSQDVPKGLDWLQRAAEKNDTEAIFFLGGSYLNGDVVPKDESKGYSLLQQAASLGDAEAYFNMARCNDNGWGVPRNERRAVKFYEEAAALQDVEAMRVLGISYVDGLRGLSQDVSKGLNWLQRAAEKNDTEAIFFLGGSYLNGDIVPKDESKGYSLLQQAASLGNAEAYFNMARCNDNGWGVPRKERRAVKLYKKAADMQNAKAMRVLGMSYMQGLRGLSQDVPKGLDWLQRAAEKNDTEAIRFLGDHYDRLHVWQTAVSFYEKGLELGNHECMENLARLYATGNDVSGNDDRALELYSQFAERHGDENDLISPAFGYIYALYGLPQNYEMAFALYTKAASMGSVVATNRLAWHYRSGCGVPASIQMAYFFLDAAIRECKYPYSVFLMVDILASSTEPSELRKVRAVVEDMPDCGDLNVRARWFLPFVDTQLNAFKFNQFGWLGELRPDFVSDSDVQVIARIGWGQFGNVFLARLRRERWVAVKFMNIDLVEQKAWATTHVLHERFTCRVLEKQSIPHVVKYIGFVDDLGNSQRGLVFDLCADIRNREEEAKVCAEKFVSVRFADLKSVPDWSKDVQSSLRGMVVHPGFRHFSVADVLSMLANVADAVSAIHKLGYLHRDIADRNVLCDHHGNVQLADFGLAKYVGRGFNSCDPDDPINQYARNMTPGHPYAVAWWPPECVGTGKYKAIFSASSDVYSFGVLIWQCFTGRDPFDEVEARSSDVADREAAAKEIIQKILNSETPNLALLYPDTPEGLRDLLERCWLSDPDRRPSMADVAAELRRIHDQPVSSRGHAQTITSWNDATSKWFNFQTYWDIPMEELQNHIESSPTRDSANSITYPEKVLNQRLSEVKHEVSPANALDGDIMKKLHPTWRPFDMFIVHTGKQKDLEVATLKDHYEMCGFRCFVDYEMSGADGSNTEYMRFALATCRYALVVLSKEFLGRPDPCAELMFAFQRMEWLRKQKAGGWESMWVVLYKISLKSYKKIYQTRRDQLPKHLGSNMTLYIYPNNKYRDWAILYNKIKNEMVVHDTAGNAIKRWQQYLTQFPESSLEPPFSSLGTLYNTEANEQNS